MRKQTLHLFKIHLEYMYRECLFLVKVYLSNVSLGHKLQHITSEDESIYSENGILFFL